MDEDLIGTAEAARVLGVTQRTAKRLAQRGELRFVVKMPGDTGAYLFNRLDVEAYRATLSSL